jgi:hypothetical protein
VPNVKFSAWRDSGCDDVMLAMVRQPLGHDIGPVHDFTSNSNSANQSTKGNIIDFVSGCFVDQDDCKYHIATSLSDGIDGFGHGHS